MQIYLKLIISSTLRPRTGFSLSRSTQESKKSATFAFGPGDGRDGWQQQQQNKNKNAASLDNAISHVMLHVKSLGQSST